MKRQRFVRLVQEGLDALPEMFRNRMENIVVLVEDYPAEREEDPEDGLLMGEFIGVARTEKSIWDAAGPDRIVLYQGNIEAVCETDEEIREEVRLTLLHELGHYFGMDEDQLEDV